MQVRSGVHPKNQDEDVRFRTTYYFRAFDYCYGRSRRKGTDYARIVPGSDSLYRFRMTGKANSFTTKVHFESGTLRSSEIDPFGAAVVYDANQKRFRYMSRKATEEKAERAAALADYDALRKRLANLDKAGGENADLRAALIAAMKRRLTEFAGVSPEGTPLVGAKVEVEKTEITAAGSKTQLNVDTELKAAVRTPVTVEDVKDEKDEKKTKHKVTMGKTRIIPGSGEAAAGEPARDIFCRSDAPVNRGFQILGPEGWRTFDQEERLILAMSTDASPLIGSLRQFSSRILNANADPAKAMLPLVREQLVTTRAQRVLDRFEGATPTDIKAMFEQVLVEFNPEGGK